MLMYEVFNRRDLDGMLALMPDEEVIEAIEPRNDSPSHGMSNRLQAG